MAGEFQENRAYDSNGRLEYYGQAEPGTRDGEAKWMIRRYTYQGINETGRRYPNGDTSNIYVWNDRETYTYR